VARATAAAVPSDQEIKARVVTQLQQAGIGWWRMNVVVSGGVVHLWGGVDSEAEKLAARIALGNVDGVRDVQNHLSVFPPGQLGAR
jgi:osmotically-inducible protein OsmY